MDLLHATKFSHPKVGGIERVAHELCKGCVTRGDDVTVVSAVERGRGGRAQYDGVSMIRASSFGVTMSVPVAPTFPLHLRREKQDADLIHFHLPDPLSVGSELMTGNAGNGVVATIHGEIARNSYEKFLPIYRPILDRFLERVDRIVVSSPRHRERSALLGSYRNKCIVIPLGIDLEQYGTYEGKRYRLPGNPDRPTVLFVGRLVHFKGVEYAIDAMQTVDADLVVVGTGEFRDEFEKRAIEKQVDEKVHFLGYVSDEQLHYYYDTADVFLLPSSTDSETFGIVQIEAMAYGTPVVNTDLNTSVPWVSPDGETGITVSPGDAEAISEALRTLLNDASLRVRYGERAKHRVSERFTRERMVSEYLDLYDELVPP